MNAALEYPMSKKTEPNLVSQTISRYGRQLLSFIRGKVRLAEDAEDILQEVWYQFSKLSNIDELESVSGWLYSVTRNRITDLYRKRKTSNLEDFTFEDEDGVFNIRDILLLDDVNDPELAMFKEFFWNELFKALDELPENQRKVFVENSIEDKTLQEIADEQGENIKTIISRKGYAVKHLQKRLLPLYLEWMN
jgi:RNA polymerase sigma factor (sigma-70 family)